MRQLKYKEALSEGLVQAMERDESIFVTGISVDYEGGVFGTTSEALKRFGPSRVFDAPAMENALTGIAIGAAAMGKRPVIVHPRVDFSFLAMDQLFNLAAKWKYMYGGNAGSVPVVTRAIIGRGWGQGATHSQSLQSIFAHFPGLNVAMPATPYHAKGIMTRALSIDSPTVILEYRSLYEISGWVPEEYYCIESLKPEIIRDGVELTIVATSFMLQEALDAREILAKHGIVAEIINPMFMRPFDPRVIAESVKKTGRLVIVDTSWALCGFSAEVAAVAAEHCHGFMKAPVKRITLPDCPAPVSKPLEDAFYPTASTIVSEVQAMFGVEGIFPAVHKNYPGAGPY